MGGFNNPVVGALNLIRKAIRSPNYVSGSVGWTINQDGTAEFNTLGGSFQITANGIFFYVPVAGSGNLRMSLTNADGNDPYGNSYKAGLFLNQRQAWLTGDQSDTILINPNSALGPEILFAEAGSPFATHLQQFTNELRAEAVNASGALFRMNMPVLATGGLSPVHTAAGAQPPFTSTGVYVAYASADWAPLDIVCPPSETIQLATTIQGHNNNSVNANVAVQARVNDQTTATLLLTPSTATAWGPTVTSRSTTDATDLQSTAIYTFGQDVLGGRAGHTIRFTPMWRQSSSNGTSSIGYGSMVASPQLWPLLTSG